MHCEYLKMLNVYEMWTMHCWFPSIFWWRIDYTPRLLPPSPPHQATEKKSHLIYFSSFIGCEQNWWRWSDKDLNRLSGSKKCKWIITYSTYTKHYKMAIREMLQLNGNQDLTNTKCIFWPVNIQGYFYI